MAPHLLPDEIQLVVRALKSAVGAQTVAAGSE
jgi:hypothetical protein